MSAKIIKLFKDKKQEYPSWFTNAELENEKKYFLSEIKQCNKAIKAVEKIDMRCACTPETEKAVKMIKDFKEAYEFMIDLINKEQVKRFENRK